MKIKQEDIQKYGTDDEKIFLKEFNDFSPKELKEMLDNYDPEEVFRAIYEWAKENKKFDVATIAAEAYSKLTSGKVLGGITKDWISNP